MKIYSKYLVLAMTAGIVLAGCSKSAENSDTDPHAGHHRSQTKQKAAAAPTGAPAAACAAHGAPKNQCFICDPALRDKARLWCREHARYEDRCWDCHPELQDKTRLFCDEHGLYEDECFICHPEVQKPKPEARIESPAIRLRWPALSRELRAREV
jgi:hypothetical protein